MQSLVARPRRSQKRCASPVDLARTPLGWGSAAFALGASLAIQHPLGVVIAGSVALLSWVSAAHPALQERLARARAREALRKCRDARETRLEDAGLSRETIAILTELVDRIVAAKIVSLPELETVLDHYAELSIMRARLIAVLTAAHASSAAEMDSSIRCALVRRRNAHLEHCRQRCTEVDRDMRAIERRIRTLADRVVMPYG